MWVLNRMLLVAFERPKTCMFSAGQPLVFCWTVEHGLGSFWCLCWWARLWFIRNVYILLHVSCFDSMWKLLESVDEMETSNDVRCHDLRMTEKKRRGQPTCVHIWLDHVSAYDWTIDVTDKTNVVGGNDVIYVGDDFFVAETMTWRFDTSMHVRAWLVEGRNGRGKNVAPSWCHHKSRRYIIVETKMTS